MKRRIIANPPISIYDQGGTEIKHATFLYLLDTIARFRRMCGEEVIFPSRSYNVFGQKANGWVQEDLDFDMFHQEIISRVDRVIASDKPIRERMNLGSLDLLLDNDEGIIMGVKSDFSLLVKRGYIFREGNRYYLDCLRIHRDFNLDEILNSVFIHPNKASSEMRSLIKTKTERPVVITRSSFYAPENPLGGQNIGPLFTLSRLWDHKYPDSKFTMAASNNVLLKYVFLRFLTNVALYGTPGFDELIIWPKVYFEGGNDNWSLGNLLKTPYDADMLRVALLSKYPTQDTRVALSVSDLKGSRNFVYLIANLRKPLRGQNHHFPSIEPQYFVDMRGFKYPKVLQKLEIEARDISHQINDFKDRSLFDME